MAPWRIALSGGHSHVTRLLGSALPLNGEVHTAARTIAGSIRQYLLRSHSQFSTNARTRSQPLFSVGTWGQTRNFNKNWNPMRNYRENVSAVFSYFSTVSKCFKWNISISEKIAQTHRYADTDRQTHTDWQTQPPKWWDWLPNDPLGVEIRLFFFFFFFSGILPGCAVLGCVWVMLWCALCLTTVREKESELRCSQFLFFMLEKSFLFQVSLLWDFDWSIVFDIDFAVHDIDLNRTLTLNSTQVIKYRC